MAKHAWYIRPIRVLHHAVSWHSSRSDETAHSKLKGTRRFLPRLGHDPLVRLVTLRLSAGHEDRALILELTPEEAMDIGTALVREAQKVAAVNMDQGNGWALNPREEGDGWHTATATADPVTIGNRHRP